MDNNADIDWQEMKRQIKIATIKTRRWLHRVDKKFHISQNCKRVILLGALKIVSSLSPNPSIAQTVTTAQPDKDKADTELYIAKADTKFPEAINIETCFEEYVDKRLEKFAQGLSGELEANIKEVKAGKKIGKKAATLTRLFGKVNTQFYCAYSGLETIRKYIEKENLNEYKFLQNCIDNPHACNRVVAGLNQYCGKDCYTKDILQTLKQQQNDNPNSVFIVVRRSSHNTSSGKHFVIVTPKFAADTLVYVHKSPAMQVYGFNTETIQDVTTYFKGQRNIGYVYNLSQLGADQLKELYFSGNPSVTNEVIKIAVKKSPISPFTPVARVESDQLSRLKIQSIRAKEQRNIE